MLEVFYAGALRVSEIVGIKLEDLKLDAGYILVRGKGDKERIVPLGKSAQEALTGYIAGSRSGFGGRRKSAIAVPGTSSAQADAPASLANRARRLQQTSDAMRVRTCCVTVARLTWWRTART